MLRKLKKKKKKKKKKKGFGSLPAPHSGYAITIMVFFAHLLILEYLDQHQNLISSSLYYPGPLHKISLQSVHNVLSNVVHRQTDRQTNRQTNATKNITSFAKEVIINILNLIPYSDILQDDLLVCLTQSVHKTYNSIVYYYLTFIRGDYLFQI